LLTANPAPQAEAFIGGFEVEALMTAGNQVHFLASSSLFP
jgi:hypothetical protein